MIPPNLLHLREPGTDPACSKGEKLGAELSAICHMGVPNTMCPYWVLLFQMLGILAAKFHL